MAKTMNYKANKFCIHFPIDTIKLHYFNELKGTDKATSTGSSSAVFVLTETLQVQPCSLDH